jgi:hypothetical protein
MSIMGDWEEERHDLIMGGPSEALDDEGGSILSDWAAQRDAYDEEHEHDLDD